MNTKFHFALSILLTMFCFMSKAQSIKFNKAIVDDNVIFEETEGFVAIEAEYFYKQSKSEIREWHRTSKNEMPNVGRDDDAPHCVGASNNAYIEILPDERVTHSDELVRGENFTTEAGKMAVVHYKVKFNTPGRYFVWVRSMSTGSEDNSLHLGLNGEWPEHGKRMQWCDGKNKWTWASKQRTKEVHCGVPYQIYLDIEEAGVHEIQFSMREDGFEMDKFILTIDKDYIPKGLGPLENFALGKLPIAFPDLTEMRQQDLKVKNYPSQVKIIHYESAIDKSQQPSLIYTAKDNRKRPLLVGLHSWSSQYDSAGGDAAYARWCIENDWHFVHPHFRGANWTPQSMGSEYVVSDIVSIVEYMKKNFAIDEDRIYMVGASGGAFASLLMAGRHPEIWAGVSAWCPITDLRAWWEQKDNDAGSHSKYARHIERAVGGRPDENEEAALEVKKRSPITYLNMASDVNIDINAGITDGHLGGSVPFTHSLYAFNQISQEQDRIDVQFIKTFYEKETLPEEMPVTPIDSLYGKNNVIFRKVSNNTRVTIFQGGHEIIFNAALNWLAQQRKSKRATWKIDNVYTLKTKEKESESGK